MPLLSAFIRDGTLFFALYVSAQELIDAFLTVAILLYQHLWCVLLWLKEIPLIISVMQVRSQPISSAGCLPILVRRLCKRVISQSRTTLFNDILQLAIYFHVDCCEF